MTTDAVLIPADRQPPTAAGLPLLGNALPFLTTAGLPVHYLQQVAQRYGDLVRLKVGPQTFYVLSDPALTREVLVKRVNDFGKKAAGPAKPIALARFLGDAILTANYETWRPQRKLIQPLMHTQHIIGYAETMTQMGARLLERWQTGATRDVHADMLQVTMWIIAETMFGMDVTQTPELQTAADRAQAIAVADLTSPLPPGLTPGRERQAAQVNAVLTQLVNGIMAERRAHGYAGRYDLLSLLMDTKDEDGAPLPDAFVRDNILTLFFAGHETTANTLTWAFYYLSQHPAVAAALRAELDTVLAGRAPTFADLPRLTYTLMVIKETMRIEPTVAVIPRRVMADTTLGGYQLPAGGILFLSPYVLHHDPRWWPQPEVFDPLRFSAENEPTIPDYAYLPFGGGPRVCIGNHFSLMEAQLLLAQIAARYDLALSRPGPVARLRQVTTAPTHGLPMRLTARA